MRKTVLAIGGAIAICLSTAVSAFADSGLPPPGGSHPSVLGGGGTAFTGANVAPWAIALAVLLVAGTALLAISRRRSIA